MSDLRKFHKELSMGSRSAKLTIGAVILVTLAVLSAYGYRIASSSPAPRIVANAHLPSP